MRPRDSARVPVPTRMTSFSSDVMIQALRGSITRSASPPRLGGFASESTLPRASTTRAIRYGVTR